MRKLFVLMLVLFSIGFIAGCGGDEEVALPAIPEEAINMAIDQIKQNELVNDADNTIAQGAKVKGGGSISW